MNFDLKEMKALLAKNGFAYMFVDDEEFEDGVGTQPGHNFVKNRVWYTLAQAGQEAGLTITKDIVGWQVTRP